MRSYTADKILIATGGWPHIPKFPGSELAIDSPGNCSIWSNFRKRLAIVGGGYIAVEFAGIFNGLGAKVSQLYRGPLFYVILTPTSAPTRRRKSPKPA